jgi:DNA-binding NarL/FixJ family response regulator
LEVVFFLPQNNFLTDVNLPGGSHNGYGDQKMQKTKTGLIVARPGIVREGLEAVISAIPGLEVLAPVDNGNSALKVLEDTHPDLIVLDSSLPFEEIQSTLKNISSICSDVCSIVIADHPRNQTGFNALGANAVLVEGFSSGLLTATIKKQLAITSKGTDSVSTQEDYIGGDSHENHNKSES